MRVRLPCSANSALYGNHCSIERTNSNEECGRGQPDQAIPSYTGVSQISKYKWWKGHPQPNLTAPYIQTDRRFYGQSSRLNLLLYSTICRAKSAHAQLRMHWRVEQGCSLDVFVFLRVMFPNHSQHTCLGWGCWFLLEMWRRFFPYNTECNCGGTIFNKEAQMWCCQDSPCTGKGEFDDNSWFGEEDEEGRLIGADCTGTALNLTQACNRTCNYHEEDKDRNFHQT